MSWRNLDWSSKIGQGTAKLRDGYSAVEKMVMSLRRTSEIPPTSKQEKQEVLDDRSDEIVKLKTKRDRPANVEERKLTRSIQIRRPLEENAPPKYELIEGPCASIVV